MWLLALVQLAHALPPDGTPYLADVGNGNIDRIAISSDGSVVVGRDKATDQGFVVFVEDWSTRTLDFCTVTGAAVMPMDDGTWDIWTSCTDGVLRLRNFDGETLSTVADADGNTIEITVGPSLSGVWYHPGSGKIYPLSVTDEAPTVHVVDPIALTVDADVYSGYPLKVEPWSNFREGVISGDRLFIHHAADNMTAVTLGESPYLVTNNPFAIDVVDIAPSWNLGVYAVSETGFVAEFNAISQNYTTLLSGLSAPVGVVASLDPADPWLVVTGEQIKVWEMTDSGAIVGDSDDYYWASNPDLDNPIQDAVVYDGYMFGGGEGGNLHVSTARPWVYPAKTTVTPTDATEGDVLTVTFAADSAGEWELFRGGDRYGTGELLASGELDESDIDLDITVEVTVTGDWDEGDNHLYVVLTTDEPLSGHARTTVFVDNPPDPPKLNAGSLLYSDEALVLEFEGIDDLDLDRYEIYVTTTPFSPGDWPTGGPEYDGTTRLKAPISVTKAGGESVSVRIEPLENDVLHYVAVRAWDQGGLEGDMSRVISETPRRSFTAGELVGDQGGTPCSTSPVAAGWLVVLAGGAAAARRRRLAAAAAVVGLAVAPASARAQEDDKQEWGDLTPERGNFELRYGVIDFADNNRISDVYNNGPANLLQVEAGPQFARLFEIDVGFGFFQELDQKIDDAGIASADKTMLTWWPLGLDGTVRLQLFDEQLVVPHARVGLDYIIYSEKADDGLGGKDTLRGAKTGWHWALGGGLLLDTFARRRASLLEAQTGINDTYLILEVRDQNVDGREVPWGDPDTRNSFDFSGRVITAGLKLDY